MILFSRLLRKSAVANLGLEIFLDFDAKENAKAPNDGTPTRRKESKNFLFIIHKSASLTRERAKKKLENVLP